MKKLFFVFWILLFCNSFGQVNRTMSSGYCADTLKAGQTTVNVLTDYPYNAQFTISIKTTSGTDTVYVSTISRDSSQTSRKACIDLSNGSPVTFLTVTTTPKEYLIYDPQIYKIKLETLSGLLETLFVVSRK
jgi:hypothetical protein